MASVSASWRHLGEPWNREAQRHAAIHFVDTCLRGAGQVMFQNNPLTGLLFLGGIFWGAIAAANVQVGIGAVVGLVVSTATAMLLNVDDGSLRQGLYGFNGILVGVALPTFLRSDSVLWGYLVIGSAISTIVMLAIAYVFKTWGTPALTFPFVLTTWMLLLGAYAFRNVPITSLSAPALPHAISVSAAASAPPVPIRALVVLFENVSQVFLINNVITGVIFVLALAVSSRWAALFALIGSLLALLVAVLLGADNTSINNGLFGFSAVLTAIALGGTFLSPSPRVTVYMLLGVVFTVVVQGALNIALAPLGVPTLTAPFVFATWLFLLPKGYFVAIKHEPIAAPVVGASHSSGTGEQAGGSAHAAPAA